MGIYMITSGGGSTLKPFGIGSPRDFDSKENGVVGIVFIQDYGHRGSF